MFIYFVKIFKIFQREKYCVLLITIPKSIPFFEKLFLTIYLILHVEIEQLTFDKFDHPSSL